MRRGALCIVPSLLLAFFAPLAQSQERTLRRMSGEELKTFEHDALHDLELWETTIVQIDGHLEPKYQKDHLARESADLTQKQISDIRETLGKVAQKETLRSDVTLLIDMDSLDSNFDDLATNLGASPDDVKDDLASADMESFSLGWQESLLNVRKQINHYEERFYEHALATVSLADLLLPPDWLPNSRNDAVGDQPHEPLTKSDVPAAPAISAPSQKNNCSKYVSSSGDFTAYNKCMTENGHDAISAQPKPQPKENARKAAQGIANAMMAYGWAASPHWRPGECQSRQNGDTTQTVCAPGDPNLDACIYDWQTTHKFTCLAKDGEFIQY